MPRTAAKSSTSKSATTGTVTRAVGTTTGEVNACGCAMPVDAGGRKAVAVDPEIKTRNTQRLRRIEGQVRGLQKMVEEDRYCADILTQIASVHEALRSVGKELMRNHLKHCASDAIRKGPDEAAVMYDELVEMIYRTQR